MTTAYEDERLAPLRHHGPRLDVCVGRQVRLARNRLEVQVEGVTAVMTSIRVSVTVSRIAVCSILSEFPFFEVSPWPPCRAQWVGKVIMELHEECGCVMIFLCGIRDAKLLKLASSYSCGLRQPKSIRC